MNPEIRWSQEHPNRAVPAAGDGKPEHMHHVGHGALDRHDGRLMFDRLHADVRLEEARLRAVGQADAPERDQRGHLNRNLRF